MVKKNGRIHGCRLYAESSDYEGSELGARHAVPLILGDMFFRIPYNRSDEKGFVIFFVDDLSNNPRTDEES